MAAVTNKFFYYFIELIIRKGLFLIEYLYNG